MTLNTAFRILLRLYPREHQELFAAEMLSVLEEKAAERRGKLWAATEMAHLLTGAAVEWAAQFGSPAEPRVVLDDIALTRNRIDHSIRCRQHAIAHRDSVKARFYSIAEQKFREKLRLLEAKEPPPPES